MNDPRSSTENQEQEVVPIPKPFRKLAVKLLTEEHGDWSVEDITEAGKEIALHGTFKNKQETEKLRGMISKFLKEAFKREI